MFGKLETIAPWFRAAELEPFEFLLYPQDKMFPLQVGDELFIDYPASTAS